MKAELKYSNGWIVTIPKYNNAPMLLLEYLSDFSAGRNWLHKVNNNLEGYFTIRLNMTKEQLQEAVNYINNNL